jgi:hypothetical protein
MTNPNFFPRLFSTDSAKAAKASGFGYLNAIHYMAPHASAGVGNLCSHASPQCIALCLGTHSGQAAMVSDLDHGTNSVRESRKDKARRFMSNRADYLNRLARDIIKLEKQARNEGLALCVRLNGSTDIAFERQRFALDAKTLAALAKIGRTPMVRTVTLPELFPHIQFVDYTKNPNRLGKAPTNLSLTLSYSGANLSVCLQALASGHNVAVVFGEGLPDAWHGHSVINGDLHDLRHLDPKGARGYVVGLTPKGLTAKRDTSGFVVRGYNQALAA